MRLGQGSIVAGHYRLSRLLGEGGMGDVWEATNTVTGRAVAIKRLRALDGHGGRMGRARFVMEAQAACAVEHPNVVEILDFVDSAEEAPIIVMELLRGETLAARLEREQALSTEVTAGLLAPVVSAVGTAHARGIVHRDLKPANIFLQESGGATVVKVLDFGIAKWMSPGPSDGALRTETGSTLGTPCYMAPEQALGERVIDHRADLWALGVILYECLSGMRPVEGENAARIMVRLLSTGIMPLERLVPDVPPELAALVATMLSREPSQRPGSLAPVQQVLRALTREPVPDFGEPQVTLAPPSASSTLTPSVTAPGLTTPVEVVLRKRHRRVPIALAGAFAALLAVGFGLRERSRATSEPPSSPVPAAALAVAPPAPAVSGESSPHDAPAPAPAAERAPARPVRSPSKAPVAHAASVPSAPTEAAGSGLPSGATCERSRDCASRLCLALSCK